MSIIELRQEKLMHLPMTLINMCKKGEPTLNHLNSIAIPRVLLAIFIEEKDLDSDLNRSQR